DAAGASIDDLVEYETRVDDIVRGRPDSIVCAYDAGRHSAARIAAVLDVHGIALVRGHLRRTQGTSREAPRERLIGAAHLLFSRAGIGAVGVDAIIDAAGVAKATFYRHFRSKDELIVAWL